MHKITACMFAFFIGNAALGLTISPARAALLLVDGSGQLTGAQNVDVLGTLYTVILAAD